MLQTQCYGSQVSRLKIKRALPNVRALFFIVMSCLDIKFNQCLHSTLPKPRAISHMCCIYIIAYLQRILEGEVDTIPEGELSTVSSTHYPPPVRHPRCTEYRTTDFVGDSPHKLCGDSIHWRFYETLRKNQFRVGGGVWLDQGNVSLVPLPETILEKVSESLGTLCTCYNYD